MRQYTKPHTVAWSERVEAADGFVCFSEAGGSGKPTQELSMDEKERLAKAEAEAAAAREAQAKAEAVAAEANAALTKFAEQQRADRHAGYVQFAEGALAASRAELSRTQLAVEREVSGELLELLTAERLRKLVGREAADECLGQRA